MAQRIINLGTSPDMGDGDEIRVAFDKTNQNFTEVYTTLEGISSPVLSVAGRTGNVIITANDVIGIESYILSNTTINYDNISNKPSIPSALSQLTNDAGFITSSGARDSLVSGTGIIYTSSTGTISVDTSTIATVTHVAAQVSNLVNSAPAALDTLKELSDALGADANFSSTISTALGNRLRVDANQTLSVSQQTQARTNLGLATVAASGSYTDLSNKPTLFSGSYNDLTNKPALASVATTGNYLDLSNRPVLSVVAGTGSYSDLLNKPILANIAATGSYNDLLDRPALFSGNYNDLTNRPILFSGSYNDLLNKPTLFSGNYNDLVNKPALFSGNYADLTNKPVLATVATSGQYSDLSGTPTLATVATSGNYTDLTNKPVLANVASTGSYNDLLNKPTLFSGSYTDLTNKPVLANVASTGNYTDLTNKPVLANVATSGSYTDLINAPTNLASQSYVDTAISNLVGSSPAALDTLNELAAALNNDANFASTVTNQLALKANISSLANVATSGNYSDLSNKPALSNVALSGSYTDLTNKPTLFSGSYTDLTNKPTLFSGSYTDLTNKPNFATVATSGSYTDLLNKPTLFSGNYADLTNKPVLANVATSGQYSDLSGTPTLANVAISGNYNDLTNKPTLFSGSYNDLSDKPTLFSGNYNDLTNKPLLFSGSYTDLTNLPVLFSGNYNDLTNKPTGMATQSYVDTAISNLVGSAPAVLDTLNELASAINNDSSFASTISNQLALKANIGSLANVATTGSYNDLTNKPTLFSGSYTDLSNKPALANVATSGSYSDLSGTPVLANVATSGSYNDLTNKPVLANVATSGSYNDLTNQPTLFSGSYNDLTNKPNFATVATSGSYTDLLNKPTLFSGSYTDLTNKPVLANVATSGSYNDLTDKPTITISGDATGSGTTAITLTLANTAVMAGTYKSVTVDSKGRVTAGTNPTTISGYGITDAYTKTEVDSKIGTSIQAWDADLDAIAAISGTSGLLKKTATNTWSLDTNTYLTNNQTITVSGDASGSGTTAITLTLANTAVTAGTYKSVTVDSKGRVTAGTNPTTISGYGITDAYTKTEVDSKVGTSIQAWDADLDAIAAISGTSGLLKKTATNTWSLDTNTYLTNNQTITVSGDATGSGTTAITLTLANTAVTAGTYKSVTVDAKGRVTAGSNPTTISGYGITDAYTKTEVDSLVTGLDMKQSVRVATTADITLSGTQTIDGVSVIAGDRVLVKDQTTGSQNGIYVVAAGAWSRAVDADNTPGSEVTAGMYVFVTEGTTNADSGWVLVTNDTITLGTTALTFTQFNGLGQITAGAGLTKTGNQIDAVGTANRIAVNADSIDIANTYVGQTSITTLGNITTGTWSAGTIGTAYGGTGLTSFTANGVVYASSTGALTTGNVLVFNGSSLGIGTTPVQKLTVAGDGRFSAGSSYASLSVLRTDQSGVGNTDIALIDLVTGSGWARFGAYDGTNVGGNMQFYRDGSTRILNAGTEYMRFNSSGEAGIGVSPVSGIKLAVGTATGTVYQRLVTGSDNDVALQVVNSTCTTAFGTDATGGYLITQTAGKPFVFYTGGINERMRIDGSGNVGIGTTNPTQKLSVSGGSIQLDNAQYIRGKVAAGTGTRMLGINASDVLYIGSVDAAVSGITFNANGTTYADFNSSGMFSTYKATGVGAAALGYAQLAVQGTSSNSAATLYGVVSDVSFPSTANATIQAYFGRVSTAAATYTVTNSIGLQVADAIKGAGSTITNNYGIYVNDFTQGTNNYGIRSAVSSGANKWNIYANGTASNYFAGNVGIGTTAPAAALDINGSINTTSITSNTKIATVSVTTPLIIGGTGTTSTLTLRSTSGVGATGADIIFQTGNNGATEAMRILNSGNIGIGTSSPAAKLDVVGSINIKDTSNQGYSLQFTANDNSIRSWVKGNHDTVTTDDYIDVGSYYGYLSLSTFNTERLRIDTSGNVGIGTTSPGAKLQVTGSTANIRLEESGTGAKRLELSVDNTAVAKISANQSASSIAFETVNAERMRIDSNGVVIIGTTTPLANTRVHVEQNSNANYSTTFVPTTTKSQLVLRDLSDVTTYTNPFAAVQFGAGTTGAGWSYVAGAREGAGLSFLAFGTGTGGQATERMRINSSGKVFISNGTTTGMSKSLNIYDSTDASILLSSDTTGSGSVGWRDQGAATNWGAIVGVNNSGTSPYITFNNNGERVRIDSSGNVGIGTTTPEAKLGVLMPANPGGTPGIKVTMSGGGAGTGSDAVALDVVISGPPNSDPIYGVRSVINNIGTGQVSYAGYFKALSGSSGSSNTAVYAELDSTGGAGLFSETHAVYAYANSAASGTAGINWALTGITSNQTHGRALLLSDGYTSAGSKNLALFRRAGTAVGGIDTTLTATSFNTSSTSGLIGVDASTVAFNTASTERMRIDSNGNVGIGTTSPGTKLDVSGTVKSAALQVDTVALTDTATLTTSATTANQVLATFSSTGYRTAKYLIQVTSGTAYQAAEILLLHDGTTVTLVQYADAATGATLATFDADISGGNVRLLTTPTNAVTTYKLVKTMIAS